MSVRHNGRTPAHVSPGNRAIRLASAFLLAVCLLPVPQPAYAESGNDEDTVMEALADSLYLPEGASLSDGPEKGLSAGLDSSYINANLSETSVFLDVPQQYDLRSDSDTGIEGGAVTSVKFQNPWGTCWAFAAISSVESALIMDGLGAASMTDLSERHLVWFSYNPVDEQQAEEIGASGQGGEGFYVVDGASLWNVGGYALHSAQFLISGQGPVDESIAPYRNDEGYLVEEFDSSSENLLYSYWSPNGTWSIDESLRFGGDSGISCSVDDVTLLPLPMQETDSGDMALNQSALNTVKQAIMEDGAVSIFYYADTSQPNESGDGTYFDYDTWSQYVYEPCDPNHFVTIVGWDDSYSKDNFVEGHEPPGDGAWIVKNSWGYVDGGEGNTYDWGIDGSGYFYLSYYDLSVYQLVSYSVADAESEYDAQLQYDLVGINDVFDSPLMMDEATQIANVFTAPYDMTLEEVSAFVQIAGSSVSVKVYALNDDEDPDEGVLLASTQQTFDSAGYHRIDLSEDVVLHEGQRFSVVEEICANYDGAERWVVPIERYITDDYAYELDLSILANVVCNPGESFIGINDSWQDACVISDDEFFSEDGAIVYGNFMIKAFGNETDLDDEVSVVFTGDVNCSIDRMVDDDGTAINAGYGAVAGLVDDEARKNGTDNVTLVDAGDALQGGVVGTLTEGAAIVEIMNAAGYDYAIPGELDFSYGVEKLLTLIDSSEAQYLSCNFMDESAGDLVLAPYAVQEYSADPGAEDEDGVLKVGYVGITSPETLSGSFSSVLQDDDGSHIYGFSGSTSDAELYASVQAAVDAARSDGADYVIAIGHLGSEDASSVIANTSGIDAFIDGHSVEMRMEENDASLSDDADSAGVQEVQNALGESVLLAQTGTRLTNVGLLTIDPDASDGNAIEVELLSAQDCSTINQRTQDVVDRISDGISQELSQVVGTSEVDLISEDADSGLSMLRQETNLGDFVADAYRARLGADIALVNGGSVRSSILSGTVTKGNIVDVLPFGNELCLVEVSGQTILDALEMGARELPDSSNGFLQVSGLSYKIDTSVSSSVVVDECGNFVSVDGDRRVYDVKIDGEPLETDSLYTVASNAYMLIGCGDGMSMFGDATVLAQNAIIDSQALVDYIAEDLGGNIGQEYASPQGQGRISIEARQTTNLDDDEGASESLADVEASTGDSETTNATRAASLAQTGDASPVPLIAVLLLSFLAATAATVKLRR